jgi:2-methylcitrate dehydratase PrpD
MVQHSYTEQLAEWVCGLQLKDLPENIVADAKLRVLDILGTTLAASSFESSKGVRYAAVRTGAGNDARIIGHGDYANTAGAALANGTMAHAAVIGATLAQCGFTGPAEVLEGIQGF